MKAANYILDALYQEGIEYFFMVPAKMINPFMSCFNLEKQEKISPIVAAFEGGAMMMAEGYARASEKFGAAIVLDGPGVANAMGGVANAYADHYPVMLISGQIPKHYEMMGALQDSTQSGLDLATALKPITNASYHVRDVENLPRYFKSIVKTMYGNHKGPAYFSVAKDVLLEEIKSLYKPIAYGIVNNKCIDRDRAKIFCENIIKENSRVAILVGARASNRQVSKQLIQLSEKYNIPVASTVSSKGVFPEDHRNYLGVYGYSGHRKAIETILSNKIDILILLGFDATQWTSLVWDQDIKKEKYILQVGKDIADLDFIIDVDEVIVSDEAEFLSFIDEKGYLEKTREANKYIIKEAQSIPFFYEIERNKYTGIHPADAVQTINQLLENYICIADSGNHRAFATHYWMAKKSRGFFSANTICPMGWAIPASIGISLARNEPCVVITGDGCMLMHGMEIQTAARYNRDILYIVFNNAYYGATYFNNKRNIKEMSALPSHDWRKLAQALGLTAWRVNTLDELSDALKEKKKRHGTFLIDMICSHEAETPASEYKKRIVKTGTL